MSKILHEDKRIHIPSSLILYLVIIVNMVNSESIECKHTDDFFYTTPQNHCASYYRCHSNQISKFDCPFGTMFDFYKQKCVSSTSKFMQTDESFSLEKTKQMLFLDRVLPSKFK